jgi:hypothetical protein
MSKSIRVERIIDKEYKLPKDVSCRLDYVFLVLMICRLLVNEDKQYVPTIKDIETVSKPFLRVVQENQRYRAYVYLARDKFFSVFFPYRLHVDKVSGKVTVYYKDNKKLDEVLLSECISFKEDMTDKLINGGSEKEKGKTYTEVVEDGLYKDETFAIMEKLMTAEPCYIRYDHDLKSKNKSVHPIDHLDVNFNKLGAFKLGLGGRVNPDRFESYLSPDTKALFCNVGSSQYYRKNKTLMDVIKMKKDKHRKGV